MFTDPESDGGGNDAAFVVGEAEPDPVLVLGRLRLEHGREAAERPRGEVITFRIALGHDDARFAGLLDGAAPKLGNPVQK
ncbi:hypothetical protein [Streptomyces sp. NPDC056160]|uniref:hypothetical protein n=1 Tax=Streptomyces sp. NPDC056160 TaxID=3345731 RepID=UPI0035DE682E